MPVLAERLHAEVRPVDLGELRVTKRVETAEETVRQAVERDEVDVERVPVNRPLEAPVAQRTEGEWLVLPVMEEVLVVRKQLMLTEEVRIRTRRVAEEQEVREPVRRERVELEDATRHGVRGLAPGGRAPDAPPPAPAPAGAGESAPPAGPPGEPRPRPRGETAHRALTPHRRATAPAARMRTPDRLLSRGAAHVRRGAPRRPLPQRAVGPLERRQLRVGALLDVDQLGSRAASTRGAARPA